VVQTCSLALSSVALPASVLGASKKQVSGNAADLFRILQQNYNKTPRTTLGDRGGSDKGENDESGTTARWHEGCSEKRREGDCEEREIGRGRLPRVGDG